jgi:lipopolysaccharide biosynthesis glycosyltransferase
MSSRILNVCFSANNNYAQHFCVACYSLLLNSPGAWNIFLLSDDFSESNEKKVREMISKTSSSSNLEIIRLSTEKFKNLPKIERLGIQAYFRLFVTELLPMSVDTLLYLDSDLIVKKNILELLPSKSKTPMMAVIDGASASQEKIRNLEFPYFNSGVMMIPLNFWRQNNLSEKILSRNYEKITLADQDILNDFFNGEWNPLDNRVNVKGFDPKYMSYFSLLKEHKDAYIIHFMDVWKPWNRVYRSGWIYWKYLTKTPFKGNIVKLPFALFRTLKQIVLADIPRYFKK